MSSSLKSPARKPSVADRPVDADRLSRIEAFSSGANSDTTEGQGTTTSLPPVRAAKPRPVPQVKAISKNFSLMPEDLDLLKTLSARAIALDACEIKSAGNESFLMRAALQALKMASDPAFKDAIETTPVIKTGKPVNSKQS